MCIAIACRQNRMRSPFVSAVMSNLFGPTYYSFGSHVSEGSKPSETVCELIAELGLHHEWRRAKDSKSKGLSDVLALLTNTELVVCLEPEIREVLTAVLEIELQEKFTVATGHDNFLEAFDPILLSKDDTRYEIYKATLKCIQTLRELEYVPTSNIIAYLPFTESDMTQVLREILNNTCTKTPHVVICLDFYSPMGTFFEEAGYEIRSINNVQEILSEFMKYPEKGRNGVFIGVNFEIPWDYAGVFLELKELWKLETGAEIKLLLPNLDSGIKLSALATLGMWFADQVYTSGKSIPRFAHGLKVN